MRLNEVLETCGLPMLENDLDVTGISNNHIEIQQGNIFAALPGARHHGIEFASSAIDNGADAILTDVNGASQILTEVPIIVVEDPRLSMAFFARVIYGNPFSSLLTIGVTGTNGKTTTTHMIANALQANSFTPLLIGTLGFRLKNEYTKSARTTPESVALYEEVSHAKSNGADSVVMEVSSHALVLNRVAGITFDVAVFTGLSPDHLDFHHTMEDYYQAKKQLFDPAHSKCAIICIDDEWGRRLQSEIQIPVITYTTNQPKANWILNKYAATNIGVADIEIINDGASIEAQISIPGVFNAANAIATLACGEFLNLDRSSVVSSLAYTSVKGRLERIDIGQDFTVIVDYAHSPDAVEQVLKIGREIAGDRKIITVLGCGGDRDSAKRPLMGKIAASNSDIFVATDDNPRTEDANAIREQMLSDVTKDDYVIEIGDRQAAIHYAIKHASPGDCIMILGKGHEIGQEIQGFVHPFDDSQVAIEALNAHIA
ncbi:MAG: UDP-N-acetylmuramoyl-L-alanyl-D-glutamate--2,6-diaminopimelate ligase [Candidatus Nanopelagicales bacterium]